MKMGQNPNRKDRLPFATHFHGLRLRVKILKYLLWIGRIFYQARTFGAFLKGFPKTNNVIFWTMSECEHFWWRWRGYINVYHSISITALSNNPPESTEFYTSQSNTSIHSLEIGKQKTPGNPKVGSNLPTGSSLDELSKQHIHLSKLHVPLRRGAEREPW